MSASEGRAPDLAFLLLYVVIQHDIISIPEPQALARVQHKWPFAHTGHAIMIS